MKITRQQVDDGRYDLIMRYSGATLARVRQEERDRARDRGLVLLGWYLSALAILVVCWWIETRT